MTSWHIRALLVGAGMTVAVAAPLPAQTAVPAATPARPTSTSALRRHDTNAPIDFDAARIEVLDQQQQALLSGSVKIRQAELKLDADRVRLFYDRGSNGGPQVMRRLDADGSVRLESPSERASGRYGIYDVRQRQLTMIGDVVLTQGGTVLRGQRLSIDLDSGRSTLDGGSGGGSVGGARPGAGGAASSGGRVTGRFVVPQRTDQPAGR